MKPLALLGAALLSLPGVAAAQVDIGQVWFNPGFYSLHFDRNKGLDDKNPGFGVEWPIDPTFSLTAGTFRNSDRDQSDYAGVYVMPFEFHGVKLGAVVGGFNGYKMTNNGGWFPALIPVAAIESGRWGLNIALIPSIKDKLYGALSFQLKFRFSDGSNTN